MKVIERTITLKDKKEPLTLIPIGDIHLGSCGLDRKYLKDTIKWIKEKPNAYWIGMGDYAECISIADPRFDAKSLDRKYQVLHLARLVDVQFEELKEIFEPIKEKCLGLIEGNHERNIRKRHLRDLTLDLSRELGVPLLETAAFVRIKFDRKQFHSGNVTLFVHHGWFAGRKSGSKINAMEDNISHFDADIYLYGHGHDVVTKMKPRISIGSTGLTIREKKILMCACGSFTRAYTQDGTNYAEEKGLPPQKVGVVRIDMYPQKTNVDIHVRE